MARTFTGGSRVQSGYYVDARSFEFANVEKDGGVLPGSPELKYVRIPTLVAMAAAPALGGLFLLALPFLGFGVLGTAVLRAFTGKAVEGAREVAATVANAPMPAGSAALTGKPAEEAKGAEAAAPAAPAADALAKEIEAKRGK